MDRADIYRVYELGAAVKPLSEIRDGITVNEIFLPMVIAQRALIDLLGSEPQAKVDLCLANAQELKDKLDLIEKLNFRDTNGSFAFPEDGNAVVGTYLLFEMRKAAESFSAVFRAEMSAAATYWVPKRGTFNTRDLVDAFEKSFPTELQSTIGDVALAEFHNAGRCYAFGLWSAAGFHSCRAVEAVLRSYFRIFTAADDSNKKMWGELIDGLEKAEGPTKPTEKTLFHLKQIKDMDRNPLMHVRVILDEGDADILIHSAKVAMMTMAREILALNGPMLPLPAPEATPLREVFSNAAKAG